MNKLTIWRLCAYLLGSIFVFLTLLPFFWMVYTSFKLQGEIIFHPLAFPKEPTLQNYVDAWELGKLGRKFFNSFVYSLTATGATVFFSISAGFALAKLACRSRHFIHGLFLSGLLITVNSVMIPLFIMESKIGLYNSYLGIILPYTAFGLPVGVLLSVVSLRGLPSELLEAARIDGIGYLKFFIIMVFPLSAPLMATIAILSFLSNWNEFLLGFILVRGEELKNLQVALNSFAGRLNVNYGLQLAALNLAIVPVIVFYILSHRWLIRGVADGGAKG